MGCFSRITSQIGQFPGGNRVFIVSDKNVSVRQCSDPAMLRTKVLLLMVGSSKSVPGAGKGRARLILEKPFPGLYRAGAPALPCPQLR